MQLRIFEIIIILKLYKVLSRTFIDSNVKDNVACSCKTTNITETVLLIIHKTFRYFINHA